MLKRVWPVVFVVVFAGVLGGCGGDADEKDGGGEATKPAGPAPLARGTITEDAGRSRIDIPRVPKWEVYAKQYSEQNNGEEMPEPRTRREIHKARRQLPRLYLTHKTLTRVIAPGGLFVHRDQGTGELCTPAHGCYNPECPGRGKDGEPYAFISNSSSAYLKPDGQIAFRDPPTPAPEDPSPVDKDQPGAAYARDPSKLGAVCPACVDVRDLASETDADRERYAVWVRPHELPEILPRMRELTEEHRRRIAWERVHR